MFKVRCVFCDIPASGMVCPRCGEPLDAVSEPVVSNRHGVWKYLAGRDPVTLKEGATPLYDCGRFWVKFEGANPTGSFKDRGMTVAITDARDRGARVVACASTGNTAASMAAYAARAGMEAIVMVPAGKIASGKLAQAVAHGARVIQVEGNFDQALAELRRRREGFELLNSLNPARIEGQKTLAFEICDELGDAPDAVVLPVGNGGNIRAIWKGFKQYGKRPRMIAVQAEGSAWLVKGPLDNPQTVASAIRIGKPVNGRFARQAIEESAGEVIVVSDEEILAAQRRLASEFGIFVEPASAAPIAALPRIDGRVVCIATGHGLKDPDAVAPVDRRYCLCQADL
jgi:threonine synthase